MSSITIAPLFIACCTFGRRSSHSVLEFTRDWPWANASAQWLALELIRTNRIQIMERDHVNAISTWSAMRRSTHTTLQQLWIQGFWMWSVVGPSAREWNIGMSVCNTGWLSTFINYFPAKNTGLFGRKRERERYTRRIAIIIPVLFLLFPLLLIRRVGRYSVVRLYLLFILIFHVLTFDLKIHYRTGATLLCSAYWHGFRPGHYFCIMGAPFYVSLEDMWHKLVRKDTTGSRRKVIDVLFWIFKWFAFSYLGEAFLLSSFGNIWRFYSSVYHIGYISWAAMIALGLYLSSQRKAAERRKNRTAENAAEAGGDAVHADTGKEKAQ